jgi:hypothetical protein
MTVASADFIMTNDKRTESQADQAELEPAVVGIRRKIYAHASAPTALRAVVAQLGCGLLSLTAACSLQSP